LKARIIRVVLTQQEQGADGTLQEFFSTLEFTAVGNLLSEGFLDDRGPSAMGGRFGKMFVQENLRFERLSK
jgi:hypothetical protein